MELVAVAAMVAVAEEEEEEMEAMEDYNTHPRQLQLPPYRKITYIPFLVLIKTSMCTFGMSENGFADNDIVLFKHSSCVAIELH